MADLPPVELNTLGSVIKTAYDGQVQQASQVEAEAGALTEDRRWTPERVRQAAAAAGAAGTFTHAAVGALPGESVGTTLGQGWANVKTAFGALGNNVDDTGALQDAIDSGWPLYFPPGDYRITAPLTYNGPLIMRGAYPHIGAPRTTIVGSFNGSLIHRQSYVFNSDNTYTGSEPVLLDSSIYISDMRFDNSHAQGCCIQAQGMIQSKFINCFFNIGFRGLLFTGSAFGDLVQGCHFQGSWDGKTIENWPAYLEAYGLVASGHCTINECNFIACGVGCMIYGAQVSLFGGRFEVNGVGLRIGGPSITVGDGVVVGSLVQPDGAMVAGLKMEANYRNIWARAAANTVISGVSIHGGTNGPSNGGTGVGEYGILIESGASGAVLDNVYAGGQYKRGAIVLEAQPALRHVGGTNSAGPVLAGAGALVAERESLLSYRLTGTAFNPSVNAALAGRETLTSFSDLQLRGIKGLDILNPNVPPNNLGRIDAVSQGATTHAVSFLGTQGESSAPITSLTPTGSGSALGTGTYEYASTLIAPRGQTGITTLNGGGGAWKSVTVTAGQNVAVVLGGAGGANRKRRLYRSPLGVSGRFAGYWELPIGDTAFSDNGNTAFTGVDAPPMGAYNIPAETELDANYAVVVTPSWLTTCRVTSKATGGFTIDFGTAAPAAATVQWLLFRP